MMLFLEAITGPCDSRKLIFDKAARNIFRKKMSTIL